MRALSFDEFEGRDGDSFELLLGDGALPITLTRAQVLPSSGREGGAFTLDWLGPCEPLLPQSIYTFRDGDQQFEMFIVPIGRDRDGTRYEAVFN
jgi:hypothetical protein